VKRLLIVWHSMTGGAAQMASAAASGARASAARWSKCCRVPVAVHLQPARHTTAEDVLAADGYLFVTPENLASMSGVMKDFFDRVYYATLETHQRPAVHVAGLRRHGWHRRGTSGSAHRHRLAAEGSGTAHDRHHRRANTRGDPGAETDRRGRSRVLFMTWARRFAAALASGIF